VLPRARSNDNAYGLVRQSPFSRNTPSDVAAPMSLVMFLYCDDWRLNYEDPGWHTVRGVRLRELLPGILKLYSIEKRTTEA
jgi:hypothetical protein